MTPIKPSQSPSFGHAVTWSYVMNCSQQVFGAIVLFMLAALLGPVDFGVAALATVYVAFISMFLEQGLIAAIVQKEGLSSAHLDAAFWLTMALAVVLAALSVALSGWWAVINGTPQLRPLICVLSVSLILDGLTVVQQGLFHRKMDFQGLAIRSSIATICGGAAGVIVALRGGGVWAIAVQQLVTATASVLVLWTLSDWRPGLRFQFARARELLATSLSLLVIRLGAFVQMRLDVVVMGPLFGPTAVGLYRMADKMVITVMAVCITPVRTVCLPRLSREQRNVPLLGREAAKMQRLSISVALPVMGILMGMAPAVLELLGPRWSPALGPLVVLAITGMCSAGTLFTGPLFIALSRPRLEAVLVWLCVSFVALFIVVVSSVVAHAETSVQLLAIAGCYLVATGLDGTIRLLITRRMIGLRLRQLGTSAAPALITFIVPLTAGAMLHNIMKQGLFSRLPLLRLLLVAAGCTVPAVLAMLAVHPWLRQSVLRLHSALPVSRRGVSNGANAEAPAVDEAA